MLNQVDPSVKSHDETFHSRTQRWDIAERMKILSQIDNLIYTQDLSLSQAATLINIPKQTLSDWQMHRSSISQQIGLQNSQFLHSPSGFNFYHRLILLVIYYFGIKAQAGSNLISDFLSHFDCKFYFALSSKSLANYENTMRYKIKAFHDTCVDSLFRRMPNSTMVTLAIDEVFTPEQCLGAIDLNSYFHFGFVSSAKRDSASWSSFVLQNVTLQTHNKIGIDSVVADQGSGIQKFCSDNQLVKYDDNFHFFQSIYRWIGQCIRKDITWAQKQVNRCEALYLKLKAQQLKQAQEPKPVGRPVDYNKRIDRVLDLKKQEEQKIIIKEKEQEEIHKSIRSMSDSIHPYDLQTGERRSGQSLEKKLLKDLQFIETYMKSNGYQNAKNEKHMEKAYKSLSNFRNVLDDYEIRVCQYLMHSFKPILTMAQYEQFRKKVVPAMYLEKMSFRSHTLKAEKERLLELRNKLLFEAFEKEESPLVLMEGSLKELIRKTCKQVAWTFQRSSSRLESIHRKFNSTTRDQQKRCFLEPYHTALYIHNLTQDDKDGQSPLMKITGLNHESLLDFLIREMPSLPQTNSLQKPILQAAA